MLNVSWAKKRAEFIFVLFTRERDDDDDDDGGGGGEGKEEKKGNGDW